MFELSCSAVIRLEVFNAGAEWLPGPAFRQMIQYVSL